MAEFEYRFDKSDADTSSPNGWTGKSTVNDHAKSVAAVQFMATNAPNQSWFVPAHPERANSYKISDFRDFHNVAGGATFGNANQAKVAVGFESMSGHQKAGGRGGYSTNAGTGTNQPLPAGQGGSFGGTGVYAAQVGGWWDALNAEGRIFPLVASSDFHADGDDFRPGEYQKTYTHVADTSAVNSGAAAQNIVTGLASGNSWVVEGDLIDSLEFTAGGAVMGSRGTSANGKTTVYIKLHDSQLANANNTYSSLTNPALDHVDLIAGRITGTIDSASAAYTQAASDAAVIARFDATGGVSGGGITSAAWTNLGNGWREMTLEVNVGQDMFFRLRGTNLGLGVANQTDAFGNPLADSLMGGANTNTAAKAFDDLWFYSNPVAVPEPATLGFIGMAALLGLRRRRMA